jgi:hypothetical protein
MREATCQKVTIQQKMNRVNTSHFHNIDRQSPEPASHLTPGTNKVRCCQPRED